MLSHDKVSFASTDGIDKLYQEKYTGSFAVGAATSAGNVGTTAVAQTHGAAVLPIMQFSTDGSTWLDAGSMQYDESTTLNPKSTATCGVDGSNITVIGQNYTATTLTFYYRVRLIAEN